MLIIVLIIYLVGIGVTTAIMIHIHPDLTLDGIPLIWPIILPFFVFIGIPYKITKYICKRYF